MTPFPINRGLFLFIILAGPLLFTLSFVCFTPHASAQTAAGEIEKRPAPAARRICEGGAHAGSLCRQDTDCSGSKCQERNVFNISVAVHYEAESVEIAAIKSAIGGLSAVVFDVTDGQAEIGRATYGANSCLVVWESDVGKPKAYCDPDLMGALGKLSGGAPPSFAKLGPVVSADVSDWPAVEFDGQNFTIMFSNAIGCKTYLAGVRVDAGGACGTPNTIQDLAFIDSVDLAFGTTNGLAVFDKFNPPSSYNGPDYSRGVCAQFIDKSP